MNYIDNIDETLLVGCDPQTDPVHETLLAHLNGDMPRFRDLIAVLCVGPHVAAALAHFETIEDGGTPPRAAIALHIAATVWRSLIPAWDDRIEGRLERSKILRYEPEVVRGRVEALRDVGALFGRYDKVIKASGENPTDILADIATADMAVSLSQGWVEQDGGSAWRNEQVPGLAIAVEKMGDCWCWHVTGGKGGYRATYGAATDVAAARNQAIEAVTGIDPSENLLMFDEYGAL